MDSKWEKGPKQVTSMPEVPPTRKGGVLAEDISFAGQGGDHQ